MSDQKSSYFFILKKPSWFDVFILSIFTILITWHPFYLYGEMNLFELSLYLPGINAILQGQIPFRDFFHLRGPFELYMPAFMMKMLGANVSVLSTYFYLGTIFSLLMCVCIAAQIFQSRLFLYLGIPVLIARTFPRVVFTFWGGMRFAFGLVSVFFLIYSIRKGERKWLFFSGLFAAVAFFTSVEIGVCSFLSAGVALALPLFLKIKDHKSVLREVGIYLSGVLTIVGPYVIYLIWNHALIPYWDTLYSVVTRMPTVIDTHLTSEYPRNFIEAFLAMINPGTKNFRQMTPSYLYLLGGFYIGWRIRNQKINNRDLTMVGLGVYGLFLYIVSFRGILAAQFEMALQPEKIIWFYALELTFLFLFGIREKINDQIQTVAQEGEQKFWMKKKYFFINLILCFMIIFSIMNALARYNRRFFVFQYARGILMGKNPKALTPLAGQKKKILSIERGQGMVVPAEQAKEIESIVFFIQKETTEDQTVVLYPEQGIYNFLFDRPFLGRFPVPIFTWFNDRWHAEFIEQLKDHKPKFIITPRQLRKDWEIAHLSSVANRKKYDAVMTHIYQDYALVSVTPFSYIYKLKIQ